MTFNDMIEKITMNEHLVIAIDGPSGSGKSTLAAWLRENHNCSVFHCDDYFLPDHRKIKERLQEAGGNIDYERMEEEIFAHLKHPNIQSNHFNCHLQVLQQRKPRRVHKVIVVEGVYSMHPRFRSYYDIMMFLDIPRTVQYKRILDRSNKQVLQRFITQWIPLEDHYFSTFDCKNQAHIVLNTSQKFGEFLAAYML